MKKRNKKANCRPLIVLGKTGTLGTAFSRICDERNIHHLLLSRADLDLTDTTEMEQVLKELNPWGVINAAGYVNVDEAEADEKTCMQVNAEGPALLAAACYQNDIRFLSFSTDLVFDGSKDEPYTENDATAPLNVYGRSKARLEELMAQNNPDAMVIRTSSFFGPWDNGNFVSATLKDLREGRCVTAATDLHMSPTYVPDLAHKSLDLLLDGEEGIFHVANDGSTTWADLARQVAVMAGYDEAMISGVTAASLQKKAERPQQSSLRSEKGIRLPSWEDALERYLEAAGVDYSSSKIAV
jgi:dTDP-4-dehydrorhamnose reductase